MKKLEKKDYCTTDWSGGTTTQLWIYPENSSYQKRNFQYRISTASVDLETSVFTKLPNVCRKLMVLKGDIKIQHNDAEWEKLPRLVEHTFMGEWDTKSIGQCIDFNLMLNDSIKGSILVIKDSGDYQFEAEHAFIYMYCGNATILQYEEKAMSDSEFLEESDSIFLKTENNSVHIHIEFALSNAICIVCTISNI